MASKNFTGYLRSSLGDYADHDIWRFTHISTTGEVVAGSAAQFKVDSSGFYDIDVEYGNVVIESKNSLTRRWFNHGVTTINSDTSVTTLPALLNALVPASDSVILQMQSLLSDAESAKNDALQAKSDTESLFNNFDSSVADSVSRVGAFEPDVYIPFNDSLEIVRGYGTHDQIDVSAAQDGSVMVDLPSKSVDFSRASGRTVINKSGELVTLGVDEPAISSDGLGVCGEYTNKLYWSEDLTNPAWNKAGACTVSTDGTLAPDGVSLAFLVENCDGFGNRLTQFVSVDSGVTCTTGIFLKGSGVVKLIPQSGSSAVKTITLTDEWVFYSSTEDSVAGQSFEVSVYGGNGNASFYAWGGQITQTNLPMPYVKTESTPVTVVSDVASIPMRNNMPAAGQPFTIVVDCDTSDKGKERRFYSASDYMFLRAFPGNKIQFVMKDINNAVVIDAIHTIAEGVRRVAVSVGDNNCSLYADGNKLLTVPISGEFFYDLSGELTIGSREGGRTVPANSEIKNFRIIHRALSDDEIKALGGAN